MRIDDFNLSASEKASLLSYAENDKFPQAVLIEGGDAEKRTRLAKFIANMIVCSSRGEKPCGICSACRKCASGNHPDIKEYGEEKANSVFKVDVSREIRQDAFVIPNDADKKVYIIKEAQNMNEAAENALLKIFEEPPRFDYFVMTCNSRSAMLDTVLSRAVVLTLGGNDGEIVPEAREIACNIVSAMLSSDELVLCESLAPLSSKKELFPEAVSCLERIFTDCVIYKRTGENNSPYAEQTEALCGRFTVRRLYALTEAMAELSEKHKLNANYNLLLTRACILLRAAAEK